MKTINIEIPKGHEIDQENSNLSEGKIVFKEVKKALPKTWEELERIKGCFVNSNSDIGICDSYTKSSVRNTFPTRVLAEASIALAQLSQLREVYRQGWKPNFNDGEDKYIICFYRDTINLTICGYRHFFLSFQSAEIRDEFLENFRDLIETAKPLLS